MRYCPNCRRINEGWPDLCMFCNRSWSSRICRRGRHKNPGSAIFCGTCGSGDLTETAHGGRFINGIFKLFQGGGLSSFLLLIVKLAFPILIVCAIAQNLDAFIPVLIALVIFLGVIRYAFNFVRNALSIFPPWMVGRLSNYYRDQVDDYKDRAKRRDSRGK